MLGRTVRVHPRPATVCFVLACLVPACGRHELDGVHLVPVIGKVTVNGAPLTSGILSFRPNPAKGNDSPYEPASDIDPEGNYRLRTAGKMGAPLGWYKVLLVCVDPVDPKDPYGPRKSYVHGKYNTLETTDLEIEVTEKARPGSYELKVEP